MTRLRSNLAVTLLGLAFASCTQKPAQETAPPAASPTAPAKPAYKKPPRMNGRGEVTSISLEQFFALQQEGRALIYDARPAFFHGISHIPGAISLPKVNCDEVIHSRESEIKAALAAGKVIVVYCTSITCPDARAVATHISGFGYPASVFSGGWDAWKDAGMPTE